MQWQIDIENSIKVIHFEVKKPIHSLWVSANVDEDFMLMVFLYNPSQQLIGAISIGSSNFIQELYFSDTVCTMNARRHELQEGQYTLKVLPLYDRNKASGHLKLQVEYDINRVYDPIYCQEKSFSQVLENTDRYYKGDFHGHTIFSDGHQSIQEAIEVLREQEMDFMAFTEHNSIPFGTWQLPCLGIPAFELTLPIGHMNVHGIQEYEILIDLLSGGESYETLFENALEVLGRNCNLSLNHMFMVPWQLSYEALDLSKVHTIEIICDPTYPTADRTNDQAVAFMDFLWNEGINVYAIGGSDSHNKRTERYEGVQEPSIYGDPSTYVYCNGLSVENIINGIQKGHCYVARYVQLEINICNGKYLPGDQIHEEETTITFQVVVNKLTKAFVARFIMNGEVVKEALIDEENSEMSFEMSFEMNHVEQTAWWLRFGLYDCDDHVIAYVNPIYKQLNKCKTTVFKNLMEKFGEVYDKGHII